MPLTLPKSLDEFAVARGIDIFAYSSPDSLSPLSRHTSRRHAGSSLDAALAAVPFHLAATCHQPAVSSAAPASLSPCRPAGEGISLQAFIPAVYT